MSCYFRHLKDILAEAKIEVSRENREQIDRAFHMIVGVEHKECPAAWKKLKQEWLTNENKRRELTTRLQDAVSHMKD